MKCLFCGFEYKGHTNVFGKFCTKCNTYNPPEKELSIIRKKRYEKEIWQYLNRFWRRNANSTKQYKS